MDQRDASTEELCYICAEAIAREDRTVEHVVPRGLFNREDRQNLITLPAHRECNQSFAKDDEYFRLFVTGASHRNEQAKKLWKGPVMRGFHRPESTGFKTSVLDHLVPVEVHTESGIYLGDGEAMLQKADRTVRVVNRIVRGLYTLRTGDVLPAEWPVNSDLMNPETLPPFADRLQVRFFDVGNGTFLYASKHLRDDNRDAFFWLIFYRSVHFWGYTGSRIRERFPWGSEPLPGTKRESPLILP